jgi:hypothetical protein
MRTALIFAIIAKGLSAACTNPTQVPGGSYVAGDHSATANNALSATTFAVSNSATATFVAGNCIELGTGFRATAGTAPTTFHAWVDMAPTVVSMSPLNGGGPSQPFTWTVSSPSGNANLSHVFALFNTTSGSTVNTCYIHYDPTSNLLYLADDASANWLGGFVPGSSGYASNSQCGISGAGASFSAQGTQLTVTVPVAFQTAFSGNKNEYVFALDNAGQYTGWQQMGTWTVGVPDFSVTASPNTYNMAAGTTATPSYTLSVTPLNGFTGTVSFGTPVPFYGCWNASVYPAAVSGPPWTTTLTMSCNEPNQNTYYTTVQASAGGISHQIYPFLSVTTTQQYPLNTATNPAAGGSIAVYPSSPNGFYNGGTQVTLTAPTPPTGYRFTGFTGTVNSVSNPLLVSMNSAMTETATFVPALAVPDQLKGIDYSPRRHSYFRMLYDWNDTDSVSGQKVSSMVDADLYMLSQNGFNLVHLYLWDQTLLKLVSPNEPSGFVDAGGDPSTSPKDQWLNLNDFVTKAEKYGLFVELHFASGWLINNISHASPSSVASTYGAWVEGFMKYLNSTNSHKNVLIWGMAFSVGPVVSDPTGTWSLTWQQVYVKVDQLAQQYSPSPGILGLVGTDLNFAKPENVVLRDSGYAFDWQDLQRQAYTMRSLLTSAYGTTKDPDLYLMQIYHANSYDMNSALRDLTTNTSVSQGIKVAANKISVVETATSSAMNNPPEGTQIPAYGDWNAPVTTVPGQASWVQYDFCMLRSLGIQKTAYWALYDPYTMWTGSPWSYTGQDLSWNGFWGLSFEPESAGQKNSWSILRNYYYSGSLTCPSSLAYATPILSLTATSTYYTLAQPVRVTWTAAEAASLSINQGGDNTYECKHGVMLATGVQSASCAYTNTGPFSATGSQSVVITGTSVGGTQETASAVVTIGVAPIVNAVTNQNYSYTIGSNDTMIVFGNGFSLSGGNTLQLTRSGYPDVWFYDGDGYDFWDQSNFQINAALNGRAAPGVWNLYVRNNYSGTPSALYQVNINP